ncbi:MAG: hypothetical protein R2730_04385 [Chitinophagales bacterium]
MLFALWSVALMNYVSAQSEYGPIRRAEIHDMIDAKQTAIDLFDAKNDQQVKLTNNRDTELGKTAYFTLIDLIQETIESSNNSNLEKYNDLIGTYNLIANISERNVQYVNYYYTNIYNAYGILSHKSLGSLHTFLYKQMLPSIANITLFKDEELAEQFLIDAAAQYPTELLKTFHAFEKESYAQSVLEATARVAPNTIKKYFPTRSIINSYLLNSKDATVKELMNIYRQYGAESKAYFFLDKIMTYPNRRPFFSYLWPDSEQYLKELIDIRKESHPLGEYSLDQELKLQALKYIRVINDMHLMKESAERFASVDSMNAEELYTLIVYSAEEIFTSTYNGLFERLTAQLEADSIDGYDFLTTMNFNRFRTFIKLGAGYNTLNRYLALMDTTHQDMLLKHFVNSLGDNLSDLGEAVNVADTFGSLEDSTLLKKFLGHLVEQQQKQTAEMNVYGEVIYNLLISLIGEKVEIDSSILTSFELFELPPLNSIELTDLTNADNENIQQHFFFDDEDGLLSFGTFINNYKNSNWKIVDSTHYVIIESIKGNPVQIFANKPLSEREGQAQIKAYFAANDIVPSIVVHRGHSYYVHITIDQIQPETRMVFLGSCGGYHNLSQVIDRSPKVHIISSKQIGTILVNNPLLYAISESIRKGENIIWSDIWNSVGDQLKSNKKATEKFQDYIPPHKNLGAIFLQAYYELTG